VDGDPAPVLSAFRSLDLVVGMRFHSLLFAERAGVPIVPVAYASKCAAWLESRGIVGVEPTEEALYAAVAGLLPAERRAG
jgi:polysaccharide pyruvyl transferase WcaK-like protein